MDDFSMLLIEGEDYCGFSFDQLSAIAQTTGKIDSDELPEFE